MKIVIVWSKGNTCSSINKWKIPILFDCFLCVLIIDITCWIYEYFPFYICGAVIFWIRLWANARSLKIDYSIVKSSCTKCLLLFFKNKTRWTHALWAILDIYWVDTGRRTRIKYRTIDHEENVEQTGKKCQHYIIFLGVTEISFCLDSAAMKLSHLALCWN